MQWLVSLHRQERGVPTIPRLSSSLASSSLLQKDPGTQAKAPNDSSSKLPCTYDRAPCRSGSIEKVRTATSPISLRSITSHRLELRVEVSHTGEAGGAVTAPITLQLPFPSLPYGCAPLWGRELGPGPPGRGRVGPGAGRSSLYSIKEGCGSC